jgi:hypothetical protein
LPSGLERNRLRGAPSTGQKERREINAPSSTLIVNLL